MKYLDYLPDTPYKALPEAVRAEIDQAAYDRLCRITVELSAPPVLPPALAAAYRARTAGTASASVGGVGRVWKMAALLGWALLLAGGFFWLRQTPPAPTVIYRTAPAPAPDVQIRYDTVETVRERWRTRVRVERDTVYQTRPVPVVRVDTIYLLPTVPSPVRASRSVADEPDWRALTVGGRAFSESR